MRIATWFLILSAVTAGVDRADVALALSLPADIDYIQCDPSWQDDSMGAPGACSETICSAGTAMTCVAMLLSWGAMGPGNPDPGMLNAWLRDNGGYIGCGLIWSRADDYDGAGTGLEFLESVPLAFDDWAGLDAELAASDRMPMVVVNAGTHMVVVYDRNGPSGIPSSYLVLDPQQSFSADRTLADYPSGDRTIFRLVKYGGTFLFGGVSGTSNGPWVRPVMLGQNSPNPFNPQTTIAFDLPGDQLVNLDVYDVSGRLVRTLLQSEPAHENRNEVAWNGRDDSGRRVASGIYFYRLTAGSYSETKRMVLMK